MNLELTAYNPILPVFSKTSSFTRLAGENDPYRSLLNLDAIDEMVLHPVRASINKLTNLGENWDGFGSVRPNPDAMQNALGFINNIYLSASSTHLPWIQPHITSSENGDVVFEWWSGDHKLTIYVGEESMEYLQVWGPDMQTQMLDGNLVGEKFQGLWRWLLA